MNILKSALWLAERDLKIEARRAYEMISILIFSATSIIVSSIAWGTPVSIGPEASSAAFWIILFFTSTMIFTTSFTREMDRGTIGGLRSLPCPPSSILLGKVFYSISFLLIILAVMLPLSIGFLNVRVLDRFGDLVLVIMIGILDLSLVGSLVSGLVMYSEGKSLLLPFLLFPISLPILIPSLMATEKILRGLALAEVFNEVRLLLAFMILVFLIGIFTFGTVLEE